MLLRVQKMHADEIHLDVELVRRLLADQFPEWAELPLERVPSHGTDNALFQLGDDMVVRLPRIHWASTGIAKEWRWLPVLAPHLPVAVPAPLALGRPAAGYAWDWAVYGWLEGENPSLGDTVDPGDLVRLVQAFHRLDLPDAPPTRRGAPLATQDEWARAALLDLDGMIDTEAATALWERALQTPSWSGPPTWLHGDLLPGNLLVRNRRLTGLLDFALVGVGDPACDLIVAWSVLRGDAREFFRHGVGVDDATWARGRGWALSMALVALPYYKDTNPGFAAIARHVIGETLGG